MITLSDISLAYGGESVLSHLSLTIPEGGRIALMGPSGCGKSSLLNVIAGLTPPTGGTVSGVPERVSYVFQEPRLLTHRTAAQNVNAVLSDRKVTLPEAERWLRLVGLEEDMEKLPENLSGGMRQRVNIARALAYGGELLLLDEPFQGVDEERRKSLIDLINAHTAGKTVVLATHDRTEAEALSCEIYVMKDQVFIPEKPT